VFDHHSHGPNCIHNEIVSRTGGAPMPLYYTNHNSTMRKLTRHFNRIKRAQKQWFQLVSPEIEFQPIRISFVGMYRNDTGKSCYKVGDKVRVGGSSSDISISPNLPSCTSSGQSFDCYVTCAEKDLITQDRIQSLETEILPKLNEFFQSRLLTRRLASNIDTPQSCLDFEIPVSSVNAETTDLLIVVGMRPVVGILGYAAPCGFEQLFGRPVLGILNINPIYLNNLESVLITAIHEFVHVLGFSSSVYGNFVDSEGKRLGLDKILKTETKQFTDSQGVATSKVVNKLVTPTLVDTVRSHFGCSSADGAELEDYGGSGSAGSHFEATVFMNEIMTSSNAFELFTKSPIISQFTRAILIDSGWYRIDEQFPQLQYGRDTGCSILNERCENWRLEDQGLDGYFCNHTFDEAGRTVSQCTFDMGSIGFCGIVDYHQNLGYNEHLSNSSHGGLSSYDFCPLVARFSNGACAQGHACFNSNLKSKQQQDNKRDAKCYQYRCDGSRLSVVVAGNTIIECPSDGSFQRVTQGLPAGIEGYVECPKGAYRLLCEDSQGFLPSAPVAHSSPELSGIIPTTEPKNLSNSLRFRDPQLWILLSFLLLFCL